MIKNTYQFCLIALLFIASIGCTMQGKDGSSISWGPQAWGAGTTTEPTYESACPDIEIVGIYRIDLPAGLSKYSAKIRNNSNTARVVGIAYRFRNPRTKRYENESYSSSVGAGALESFDLDVSEKPPKDVKIVSCE